MTKARIAFIGAGNMAGSLIGGLIADHYPPNHIFASNTLPAPLKSLETNFSIKTSTENSVAAEQADVLVLSVKPQDLKQVVSELRPIIARKKPLIISIAAGVTTDKISQWTDTPQLSVVRCMPNTPALLRSGITGLFANQFVTEEQREIAESILRSVGITIWFNQESDLNIVTALSGSGPAYFFLIMECMKDFAEKLGLSPADAQLLTVHTALGAARMALESDRELSELRKQVTSPGGTTEQAIRIFQNGGLKELIDQALQGARLRAEEISSSIT